MTVRRTRSSRAMRNCPPRRPNSGRFVVRRAANGCSRRSSRAENRPASRLKWKRRRLYGAFLLPVIETAWWSVVALAAAIPNKALRVVARREIGRHLALPRRAVVDIGIVKVGAGTDDHTSLALHQILEGGTAFAGSLNLRLRESGSDRSRGKHGGDPCRGGRSRYPGQRCSKTGGTGRRAHRDQCPLWHWDHASQ
ncbi:hypothetical protein CHELA20_52302 [Hyphomicrobiales bacterium]|nr:hypothetical protein CHELA20_52302 [Hyphomicrobiales bacterium]